MARPSSDWKHEEGSIHMLRYLLKKNKIDAAAYGISPENMVFIEEIIRGEEKKGDKGANRKGRDKNKWYLYDIVNNLRSGLDVDKLDYFQRDMHYANVEFASTASFERFIAEARIIPADPVDEVSLCNIVMLGASIPTRELMACYPEKMAPAAMDFFSCRFRMHKTVYTHKSVKQVEFMICDAMLAADPYILIRGEATAVHPDGFYRISECIDHASALARLNDNILEVIKHDPRPELKTAQDILERLEKRELYTCQGSSPFLRSDKIFTMCKEEISDKICKLSKKLAEGTYENALLSGYDDDDEGFASQNSLSQSSTHNGNGHYKTFAEIEAADIIVEKMHVHHGLKDKNPVSRMRFYKKTNGSGTEGPVGTQVVDQSFDLPREFEKMSVRIFCRSMNKLKARTARVAFEIWCSEEGAPAPFPSSADDEN